MNSEVTKNRIAHQFLTGLQDRDWDSLRAIMTSDIVWSLPGRSLISGEARGIEAVIARAQKIVGYGLTFTLKHVLFGQFNVALALHNTGRRDHTVLNENVATVLSLRDGKISAIDTYLSDVKMANAFFVAIHPTVPW
jgi:ketosteroid isomerase-like protein